VFFPVGSSPLLLCASSFGTANGSSVTTRTRPCADEERVAIPDTDCFSILVILPIAVAGIAGASAGAAQQLYLALHVANGCGRAEGGGGGVRIDWQRCRRGCPRSNTAVEYLACDFVTTETR
jgi:hypothetical protein